MFVDASTTFQAERGPGRYVVIYVGDRDPVELTVLEAEELLDLIEDELSDV